jgi:hypothetical protein
MLSFGNNEFILRFIPAVLGSLSVPLAYFFGKEVRDAKTGVLSAALLAFSPFAIFYSQEAYSYSTVLFVFLFGGIADRRPGPVAHGREAGGSTGIHRRTGSKIIFQDTSAASLPAGFSI